MCVDRDAQAKPFTYWFDKRNYTEHNAADPRSTNDQSWVWLSEQVHSQTSHVQHLKAKPFTYWDMGPCACVISLSLTYYFLSHSQCSPCMYEFTTHPRYELSWCQSFFNIMIHSLSQDGVCITFQQEKKKLMCLESQKLHDTNIKYTNCMQV